MDPKVYGKLLTLHWRGNGVDVEALHDRFPLQQIARKGPKMGLTGTEGCGGWKSVSCRSRCFQGIRVYIGERSRSVELRGAHEGGGAPPCLVAALLLPWPPLQVSWITFVPKKRSSRRFCSIWIPLDIPFLRNTEIGKKEQFALGLRLVG